VASATRPDEVRGNVLPVVPLALLETVRERDLPGEFLEDEVLSVSMPRRLGLTGVVSTQILRYEQAVVSGTRIPVAEMSNLLQLVLRRADAEPLLREAGRRMTRLHLGEQAPMSARALRRSSGLVYLPIRRAARRLLRGMAGSAKIEFAGKPLTVRVTPAYTAQLADTACVLFTGALEELVRIYAGREPTVEHQRCIARGDAVCEWRLEA
jgi:predicted hydrocarbon binding protein